jgi:hypothetical protein
MPRLSCSVCIYHSPTILKRSGYMRPANLRTYARIEKMLVSSHAEEDRRAAKKAGKPVAARLFKKGLSIAAIERDVRRGDYPEASEIDPDDVSGPK